MKSTKFFARATVVAVGLVLVSAAFVEARGGRGGGGGGRGGGGRPSMGHVGGGGGRPSMGGGMSHSRPQASRPNYSRPSMGHASRPSVSRPGGAGGSNIASRPSGGGFNPSGGGRPNISRPTTRPSNPGIANRPSVNLPGNVGPVTRPSLPGGGLAGSNRPSIDRPSINRPGSGSRPSFPGGGDRPSLGGIDRPTTLPGNIGRPGQGNRPGIGGNRPGIDRPTTLPGDLGRPGQGNRPGIGDRPIIGGNRPNFPNRPGIGNGNINTGNINIGNNVNIGNRPNWDHGDWGHGHWNNPGWGWGGGGWAGNWHNNCIRPHYGWYNGCWNGYWGSNWYRPLAWGAVGWGLGSWTSGWGYGSGYYNPYYSEPVATVATTVPYDYSQPVVVNNYVSSDADAEGGTATAEAQQTDPAVKIFDEGLALFKSGDYKAALDRFNSALQKLPGDPVIHEVRAVTLYALGDYKSSAAALNSFLSSAPGMDWTTMSSLYGNTDDYSAQLRALEQFCRSNPNDPAAYFVLAYQYLVLGEKDAAVKALQVVTKNQPKDVTARRMLDALAPSTRGDTPAAPTPAVADASQPQTDLVGTWQASADGTTIELKITEGSQFIWKATQTGKPPVELKGDLAAGSDQLVLQSADQGAMSGTVTSEGPDAWKFSLSGAPASDPGLQFKRVAS